MREKQILTRVVGIQYLHTVIIFGYLFIIYLFFLIYTLELGLLHGNNSITHLTLIETLFSQKTGCRGASSGKPLATNCNACRYVKNAVTGECLKDCPNGWKKLNNDTCRSKID